MKRWIRELLALVTVVLFLFIFYGVLIGDISFGAEGKGKVFNWTQEGVSPFWKKPVRSEEDLKDVFRDGNFLAKLAKRLPEKEPSWNGKEVVQLAQTAVLNGQAQKVTIDPRSEEAEFEWMLAGENWKSESDSIVIWNGKYPLIAFLVPINYRGENVNLFFGSFCVNVLKRSKKAELPLGEYGVKPSPLKEEAPPAPKAEIAKPKPLVSVSDVGEIFIRIFFLRLPSEKGRDRDAMKNDPRAMAPETWKILNEAVKKTALEGKFWIKFYTREEEGPAAFVVEVEVKEGIGIWSTTKDFLTRYARYEIWPERELISRYRFYWPMSGWQKGSVSEFLKGKMHHRTFVVH